MFDVLEGDVQTPIQDVFTMPGIADTMFESSNRFWFNPSFIQTQQVSGNYLAGSSFEEKPEWRETRMNSRRQAFFGELTLDFGSNDITFPVACKHFYGSSEEALHEYLASEYINNLDFIRTFEPIGLWFDQNSTAFLLTRFEESVVSFDNVDWNRSPDDSVREHFDILGALERAAHSSARYAANDMAHRDFLVKNVGYDKTTKAIRAIDLEQMRIIQSPEEPDLENMFEFMKGDMMAFMASIHDAGFRWGEDAELRSQILRSTFLSNYRSTLRHPSVMIRHRYGQGFTDMVEDLCTFLENLSEAEIEQYWRDVLIAEEARLAGQ